MALSRIQTTDIVDNAITTAKVDDATVIGTDIVDGTIVDSMIASGAAIAHTKCAVGPVASLNVGTGANQILQLNGSGVLPVLDGTQLTGIVTDFTPIENQLARLGLHLGAVEQLAKFNMIDQVIDDYEDATGITANNATSDVYGNITNSTSGLWLGATSDFTYTGANVVQNSGDKATWMNVTFSGDFDVTFTKTGSSNDFMCGLNLVSDESGNILANNIIRWETHSVSWFSKDNHSLKHGSTVVINPGAPMIEQDTVHAWKRRSGVISFYKAGSLVHTYTQTSTAAVRFGWNGGGGATSNGMASVSYTLNPTTITTPAVANTGSSSSAELQGSAGAKYYEGQVTAVAPVSGGQVGQAVGTIFGNMTASNGSNAKAFDGTTSASAPNTASSPGATVNAYIGKDWGSGVTKTITGVKIWGSSNEGYCGGAGVSTIKLMGSNTLPSSASNGTELGAFAAISDVNNSNAKEKMSGFTTTTAYRYHWLWNAYTNNDQAFFAEVEFYEDVTAVTGSDSMSLISTTTTAQTASTKASIVLQTEDEVGTATINTDVKAGVSRDALNYVDTTLAKIGTWGSGNVYAANDVTMPGTITKAVTARSSKFHVDEVSTTVAAVEGAWVTGDQSSLITVTANGIPLGGGTFSNLVDGLGGVTGDGQTTANGFYWSAQTPASGSYIRFTFSSAKAITEARWFTQNTTYQANWKWQGSNDASTWTDLNSSTAHTGVSVSYPTDSAYAINWSWANTTAYTYYQYLWVSGAYPQLWQQEVEFKYGAVAESTTYSNQQPTLELTEGYTYKFDTSDSTLSGHTFSFATAADAAGSTEYTTGVTTSGTPGSANAYTQIVVPASAPTLYYYCSNHASMGGTANTPAEASTTSMRYKVDTKNQSYTAGTAAHTVTAVNATTSTTQKKFGTHSFYFDGDGDRLTIPDHTDFDFGTSNFTIEFWFNVSAINGSSTSARNQFIGKSGWSGSSDSSWVASISGNNNTNALKFSVDTGSGSAEVLQHTTPTTGTWYHYAVVREGTGTNETKLYVDGVQRDTATVATNFSNSSDIYIGQQGNASWRATDRDYEGYIDEIRISNSARYTANFDHTALTAFTSDANTKLLLHGDGNLTDSSALAASGKITRIHGTSLAWK